MYFWALQKCVVLGFGASALGLYNLRKMGFQKICYSEEGVVGLRQYYYYGSVHVYRELDGGRTCIYRVCEWV